MIYSSEPIAADKVVEAGVIGTGQYATAIVTQAQSIPQLNIPIVADTEIESAKRAYQLAGIDDSQVIVADTRAQALSGIERGKKVVVADPYLLMDLPLEVIAEGTGDATAGAVHATTALQNGKHVVMITKETEVVVGSLLRQRAQQAGLVYTVADGDQPSLLIALIDWCRQIGLEVLCGGKFGEQRVFVDLPNQQLHLSHNRTLTLAQEQANLFHPLIGPNNHSHLLETTVERQSLLDQLIDIRTDDLIELGIVANATDLRIEKERLHHPILWPNEIPTVLSPNVYGGLLQEPGVIDQVTYLRSTNDTSMGGGVFVTVHADNAYSRQIIQEKGHICNSDGTSCLIFRPYHLCGVETPYSILSAGLMNCPTSGWQMTQNYDVYARAKQDLSAGITISSSHNLDFEAFLAPAIQVDNPTSSDSPIPYHLVTGLRLEQDIVAGTALTHQMVENLTESPLWQLRVEQDTESPLA